MNERSVLILTYQQTADDWIDNTKKISEINKSGNRYNIRFGAGKTYPYNESKVRYFEKPQPLNITNALIYIKNNNADNTIWDSAIVFGPHICLFKGDHKRLEQYENVKIMTNLAKNDRVKPLAEYYRYIANLMKIKTPHLNFYYQTKLEVIPDTAVVGQFVGAIQPEQTQLTMPPLFPFGINASQHHCQFSAAR